MNTKKWGPHAWTFLHCIAYNYKKKDRTLYRNFFILLGEMLPCKYCRISYQYFIKEKPINKYLNVSDGVFRWLYEIHNLVNNKLRCQKATTKKDPKYDKICDLYKKLNNNKKDCRCLYSGWYFIHSLIMNYTPDKEKHYIKFFKYLEDIIPNKPLKAIYKKYPIKKFMKTKEDLLKWSYHVHSKMRNNKSSFKQVCNQFNKIVSK